MHEVKSLSPCTWDKSCDRFITYIKCCLYLEIPEADCVVAFPIRAMCSGLLVLSLVTQSHLITVHGVLETTRLFKALGVLASGQGCGE